MSKLFIVLILSMIVLSISKPSDVKIFMEARCRFCKNLIATKFSDFAKNADRHDIAQVRFYPFGNAVEKDNGDGTYTVECQHGPLECRGNLIENCAFHYLKEDFDKQYQFIICLEANADKLDNDFDKSLENCIADTKLKQDILTCADGKLGNQLHHEAAVATPKNKRYVPYITVDNKHQADAEDDLLYYLCGLDDKKSLAGCKEYNMKKLQMLEEEF